MLQPNELADTIEALKKSGLRPAVMIGSIRENGRVQLAVLRNAGVSPQQAIDFCYVAIEQLRTLRSVSVTSGVTMDEEGNGNGNS